MNGRRCERGFTLLELLLGLAMVSGFVWVATDYFFGTWRAWQEQKREAEAMLDVSSTLREIARRVQTAERIEVGARDYLVLEDEAGEGVRVEYEFRDGVLYRRENRGDAVALFSHAEDMGFYFDAAPPDARHVIVDVLMKDGRTARRFLTSASLRSRRVGVTES